MSPVRALWRALRRYFARRTARRLVARALPRGLPAAPLALPKRARAGPDRAPGPLEFPALHFFAQGLRGQAPRLLLRLSALPPIRADLSAVRALPAPRTLSRKVQLPALFRLASPLAPRPELPRLLQLAPRRSLLEPPMSAVRPTRLRLPGLPLDRAQRDLGVARPDRFRLDQAFTLPPERDPALTDRRPPTPERRVQPRTPLARAPLSRYRPRAFRLDPQTSQPANEGIIPLERNSPEYRWIPPAFRALYLDPRWMQQNRFAFFGPLQSEWFVRWWDEHARKPPGARPAVDYVQPEELHWLMEVCKEQMLIRRDVKKDEQPPQEQEFFFVEEGVHILQAEPPDLASLAPQIDWVEPARPVPTVDLDAKPVQEVYVQWRTLLGALEER